MTVLPENILKCMRPEDRKSLGKAGLTAEEALCKAEIKSEKDLQKLVVALLRLKGIEPNVSRMDQRSTCQIGWPDITFAVAAYRGIACAWECKTEHGKLTVEQEQMHVRLSIMPNKWRCRVIRSVDQALFELKQLGIE